MKATGLFLMTLLAGTPAGGATFTVTNTDDSGAGSLRQAMLDAGANPGGDTIAFDIPGSGVHTITILDQLPEILDPVTIDGYTQAGAQPNTSATGALNMVLVIEIHGTGLRCFASGASDTTIRGLVVNGCQRNIELFNGAFGASSSNVTVSGDFLGTDPSGTVAMGANYGVYVGTQGGSVSGTIGGASPAARNLISGHSQEGITVEGNFNGGSTLAIQGNVIGLDKTASIPLSNFRGILVGGLAPGLDTIGGIAPGAGNIIAGNTLHGIALSNSPTIAMIRGNSIHDNGGLGIEFGNDNIPTPNDPGDTDTGSNGMQNFPIVSSVEALAPIGSGTRIQGVLHSTASTTYDVDFYANPACSNFPREFLEGQTYIGSAPATTDASGTAVIDVTLPITVEAGARITATATDPSGNTSEFSQRIIFSIGPTAGPAAGGVSIDVSGTDFADPTMLAFGGAAATVTFVNDHKLTTTSPALAPGTVNNVVATTPDGTTGTLVNGWVADFLDVGGSHQFYSFVTTLVSNGVTAGVGGGLYGVDQPTLRQQMAVFLLKAKHGLCYVPPGCTGVFPDVPCPSTFANWIEALAAEGITGGCGGGNYCPQNPVRRDQMAVFLLKAEHGSSYLPPVCTGVFPDVPCPSTFANWIEQLAAEQITGGCGGGNYCPGNNNTRGQMAVFIVKTFALQ